jgi:hypothetical protein
LKKRDLYQFGKKPNQPDEIRTSNGTYRLRLSEDSRQPFHDACLKVLDQLFTDEQMSTDDGNSISNKYTLPDKAEPINSSAKGEIFLSVRK